MKSGLPSHTSAIQRIEEGDQSINYFEKSNTIFDIKYDFRSKQSLGALVMNEAEIWTNTIQRYGES